MSHVDKLIGRTDIKDSACRAVDQTREIYAIISNRTTPRSVDQIVLLTLNSNGHFLENNVISVWLEKNGHCDRPEYIMLCCTRSGHFPPICKLHPPLIEFIDN